ncbi:MAG: GAF domain-containing protein, partial [bacterium]|nr:GAF domain-containing protein [bacterium]
MPTHAGTRAIRLQQLLRIAKAVNSTLDLESVLQTIVDTVCDLTTWKMACIAIVDEGTQEVIFVAQRGFHDQGGRPARWPITESLTPQATAAGRTIVVSDT